LALIRAAVPVNTSASRGPPRRTADQHLLIYPGFVLSLRLSGFALGRNFGGVKTNRPFRCDISRMRVAGTPAAPLRRSGPPVDYPGNYSKLNCPHGLSHFALARRPTSLYICNDARESRHRRSKVMRFHASDSSLHVADAGVTIAIFRAFHPAHRSRRRNWSPGSRSRTVKLTK